MKRFPPTSCCQVLSRCAAFAVVAIVLCTAASCTQPTVDEQATKPQSTSDPEPQVRAEADGATSITRINQFTANPGSGDELFELIDSFMPLIRESDGCIDVQIKRGADDPDKILVIEVWRDKEAHRASANSVPPGTFEKAMELMTGPPTGEYYN